MSEKIDHPPHYGGAENPYEAIKIIEHYGLGFNLGNALKYILRAGKKSSESEVTDIGKAKWYISREFDSALRRERDHREMTSANDRS